jgi:hypothetical protein
MTKGRSPALEFVPYQDLAGAPNVVVDGSPTDGTVLCLTHWPGISGPSEFAADLSAQMAFSYLGAFDRHEGAHAVSNNHFDQDGLVSLYALSAPDAALARRELLIEVARAGDFATFDSRQAARISMALSAYADPPRSPLAGLSSDYDDMTAQLYTELLGRLDELCEHPERTRHLWGDEDATLAASEAALASGAATLREVPEVDLAVVTLTEDAPSTGGHRFAGQWVDGLHPMAICNATACGALLVARGQRYEFTYRYESWVQYRSRAIRPRVDLAPLAQRLSTEEPASGTMWVATGVSALTPTLTLAGAAGSDLSIERVVALVTDHLREARPAWDPYAVATPS